MTTANTPTTTNDQFEQTSFLHTTNAAYIGDLYERFLASPQSVDQSWRDFFGNLGDSEKEALADLTGASWAPREDAISPNGSLDPGIPQEGQSPVATSAPADASTVQAAALDSIRALILIRSYRVRGHLMADLDPLGLETRDYHPELDYRTYGFSDADLDREIFIANYLGLGETATLRDIVERCQHTYSGNIGVEYMHIQDPDQKTWLQERIEAIENRTEFTEEGRTAILERLTAAEAFENFLDRKYTGTKRFGLDGGEATIPALEQIIKRGGQLGLQEMVIGMPHRGRLNVLANMMGKPFRAIFSEFTGGAAIPETGYGSGDVKYHLGTSSDREFDGNTVHLSLTANPSHLEAVDPVVVGKVRAKQQQRALNGAANGVANGAANGAASGAASGADDRLEKMEAARQQVSGLLIHGDAAFSGQGLVPETLDLAHLRGYRTGGTIHFIINNQIGFTTNPVHSRSGPYCTEMAKIIQAPIFHVNGDDPEAVVHVARIATEFRHEFRQDVVIDMFCYRRFGHNEGDEPAFTQPIMYERIGSHESVRKLFARRLVEEGLIDQAAVDEMYSGFMAMLEQEFEAAEGYKPNKVDWLEGAWTGLEASRGEYIRGDTAVELETLKTIGDRLTSVPDDFSLNRKIARQHKGMREAMEKDEPLPWAVGEALAFGTLLVEGTPVRLSGQDSGRGTFSHRHAVLVDQETEEKYIPLANLSADQAQFEVIDSPLAEMSVLGFEYGYSLADPHALVMWEAQFGDFANGAQIIIDQFIASGEAKWLRMSGLVMLLPHGYEGQGPEHSSARLERYLQLCGEDNMQVVNCTTPAQFFHVLRRQMRRKYRKPLVVMTPKSLLRHKAATSKLADFGPGSSFHRVLFDGTGIGPDEGIERIVLCSGKVYYDLLAARDERELNDKIVIIRMEQLYPFPHQPLKDDLGRFPQAEVIWCQEEPQNMGAWHFVDRRIEAVMNELEMNHGRPRYVGRAEAASPATGLASRHKQQQDQLVDDALTL